jgi:osmoprotectant transport system permease protein
MFTNTVAGIQSVEPATIEAARGMGLTESEVVRSVEIPLAMPLVLEGVRIGLVQVIATATLGALVAWGGLGRFIVDGFAQQDVGQLVVGAVLVGLLAIIAELAMSSLGRAFTPKGVANPR